MTALYRFNRFRYNRGRYNHGGIYPPVVILPEDLLSALQWHWASLSLESLLPGGLNSIEADPDVSLPYCVVRETGSSDELWTSHCQVYRTTLAFRVYASRLDVAGRILDTVMANYRDQAFRWSYAGLTARSSPLLWQTEPRHEKGSTKGKDGNEVWYQERLMYARVQRQREF